jgi:hypothetical protein
VESRLEIGVGRRAEVRGDRPRGIVEAGPAEPCVGPPVAMVFGPFRRPLKSGQAAAAGLARSPTLAWTWSAAGAVSPSAPSAATKEIGLMAPGDATRMPRS